MIHEGVADLNVKAIDASTSLKSFILSAAESQLEEVVEPLRVKFPDLECATLWNARSWEGILHAAERAEADLIVKTAGVEHGLSTVVRTPDDWNLLRHSPIAVMLVKESAWAADGKILCALDVFDDELRERGFSVNHLLNPNNGELRAEVAEHDAVFINVYTIPFAVFGTVRTVIGHFNSWNWRSIFVDCPHVVYTAFGSPYLLYEMPHVPNLIATYGATDVQQKAAVKVWLGEIKPSGTCPVSLPKTTIRPFVE